ncbi:MAG TPA: hypothetical protein DIT40_13310 [Alphaproteobacteria bacterium]|nr:hypothetical protein [Alphaproteobacteria bacterium]
MLWKYCRHVWRILSHALRQVEKQNLNPDLYFGGYNVFCVPQIKRRYRMATDVILTEGSGH